jgi:E3 ubiquitin-protein ligase ZSWIM2
LQKAKSKSLYLMQELGPLAFVIKEESDSRDSTKDTKYRVCIGELHQCSCPYYTSRAELCCHILWVMTKILKIESEPMDDLLFQRSWSDREISDRLYQRELLKFKPVKEVAPVVEKTEDVCQKPLEEGDTW